MSTNDSIRHRAKILDKAGIRGAAGGAEIGLLSGDTLDRVGHEFAERTRRGEKGFARDVKFKVVIAAYRVTPFAQPCH